MPLSSKSNRAEHDIACQEAKVRNACAPADDFARLREGELQFRDAFAQAAVALTITGFDGRYLYVNPQFCQMLGYSEDELTARDCFSITHPDDVAIGVARFKQFKASEQKTAHFEKRYVHKSGRVIYASLNVSLARGEDGTPLYFIAHVQDDTERRRAQALEIDQRVALEMVAQDRPLPAVLHQLIRLVERQMPEVCACVMLLQDGTIRPLAPNLPPEFLDAINRQPISFAARLTAGPQEHRAAPLVADVETNPAWEGLRNEAQRAGVRCCWAVTVSANDGVALGLLVAFSRQFRAPSAAEAQVLETAIRLATISIEHHQTTRQLAHLVQHDPLTGLPNRVLFEDRLQQALAAARRSHRPLGLLAIDLNRFKHVNDTLGHHAGDSLLQQFSARLRSRLRESDTLARVGGDEFLVILPDVASQTDAEEVAQRLTDALSSSPFEVGGQFLEVTSSIGIALFPTDGEDAAPLQRAADAAMYRTKEQSKRVEIALAR